MRYHWEEADLERSGIVIENQDTTAENQFYVIGYRYVPDTTVQERVVVRLDDGGVVFEGSNAALVGFLNRGNYAPVGRPVTAMTFSAQLHRNSN